MFSAKYPPRSLNEFGSDLLRVALGIAYALRPVRIAAVPHVLAVSISALLGREPRDAALDRHKMPPPAANGIIGVCGSLEPDTLMRAYRKGIFPMGHIGPKKWILKPQRMVMAPHLMVREKDVRRALRNGKFRITFDTAFAEVMLACAEPRKGRPPLTWITRDIMDAYSRLHRDGRAHSFEAWTAEGELAGGGFGIAVGPVFVIKSQFARERNASKVAMAVLLRQLSAWGFALADGISHTAHLESLGFTEMPHEDYVAIIDAGPREVGVIGPWTVDPALDAATDWQPSPATATKASQSHEAAA